MVLNAVSRVEDRPLQLEELSVPEPGPGEVRVKVLSCGVCHTEIDEIEGRVPPSSFPMVPGHEVVGVVDGKGQGAERFQKGDRIGIDWLGWACGQCRFCLAGQENLCERAAWTGKDVYGGYAEYAVVAEAFAYPIPQRFSAMEAAPLLCAGVIGYRALRLTGMGDGDVLGLYGFGASAHIVIQVARHSYPSSRVCVFTRPQQREHQDAARGLGADWVGGTGDTPPWPLDRAIDFTPVGAPVREALRNLQRGGRVVVNAIRKTEPIPELYYTEHLWYEKELKSVANVARRDAEEFLPLAAEIPIVPHVEPFRLEDANEALAVLKEGRMRGAGILMISEEVSTC